MNKVALIILAFLVSTANADDGLDITDEQQIAALLSVQEKLDVVSSSVTECMSSGGIHNDCLCANRPSIEAFKQAVEFLFLTHPTLESADLVRFRDQAGHSVAQSLSGIRMQSALELSCR